MKVVKGLLISSYKSLTSAALKGLFTMRRVCNSCLTAEQCQNVKFAHFGGI